MLRTLWMAALVIAVTAAPTFAQGRNRAMGRSADDWCSDGSGGDRASHCEVREATVSAGNLLEVVECSVEPDENGQVVRTILRALPQLQLEAESEQVPGKPADGGYWARLRRNNL